MRFHRSVATLALLALCAMKPLSAGTVTSFNGLTWGFSSSVGGLGSCSRLVLDAIGDFPASSALGMHGFLDCEGGAFAVSGTSYFGATGTFNMTVAVGAGFILQCNSLPGATLSGACEFFNGNSAPLGSAAIAFL